MILKLKGRCELIVPGDDQSVGSPGTHRDSETVFDVPTVVEIGAHSLVKTIARAEPGTSVTIAFKDHRRSRTCGCRPK